MDVSAIALSHLSAFVNIRAIYGEASDGFTNHVAQGLAGKIASVPISGRNGVKHMRQYVDFTGKRRMHDQLLAVVDDGVNVLGHAGKTAIEVREAALMAAINEQAIYQRGEVIAGSAIHGPFARKLLTRT